MKWDALIASYVAFLPRCDAEQEEIVREEIKRLRELQKVEQEPEQCKA